MSAIRPHFLPFLLAVLCLCIFGRVQHYAFLNYDDQDYVSENRYVRQGLTQESVRYAWLSGLTLRTQVKEAWTPLTKLSHILDTEIFGANAGAAHSVNLILHILNTLLLYYVLVRMTGSAAAGVAASFFAFHPLQAETVAWIICRKDLLSTFFALGSIACYLRGTGLSLAGAGALFVCAVLSKPTAVVLPAIFLLLDFWPLRRKLAILPKLPFLAVSIAVTGIAWAAQHDAIAYASATPAAFRALWAYAFQLFHAVFPVNLTIYGRLPDVPMAIWKPIVGMVVVAGVSIFAWFQKNRFPSLFTGWFWFVIALAPVAALEVPSDRYMYFPMIGFVIALAGAIAASSVRVSKIALGSTIAAAVVALPLTYVQTSYWKDSETLFTRATLLVPRNITAHANLAQILTTRGAVNQAIYHLDLAKALDPRNPDILTSLGAVFEKQGRLSEAADQHRQALEISPGFAKAHFHLANVLAKQKDWQNAEYHYVEALKLDAYLVEAAFNYATLMEDEARWEEAEAAYRHAFKAAPDYANAGNNLALLMQKRGDEAGAIAAYNEVLRLKPRHLEARNNLGIALARQGKYDEALRQFEEAVRINPQSPQAHQNLAVTYEQLGRASEAGEHRRKAEELAAL